MLCSFNEAMGCILMGIPFSGTPLASQMLNQLKLCGSLGYFYFDFAGGPGRKTNTMGSHVISFVSPSDTQETFFIQFEVLRGG